MNNHISDRVRLSDINKTETVEIIYSRKEHDTKKINNRSEKKIPHIMLETIENGITSEQLDSFKVPVFKYGTQITIHGIFPDIESTLRVGGYKRIFQNKNKSIGVKYDAIDYDKKKSIYRAFGHVYGFRIESNSKEYCIYRNIRCNDRDEVMKKIEEYKPLFDKINLRFGSKQLYYACVPFMGCIFHYMVFTVHIDAIYEKDIPKFYLDVFGKSKTEIEAEIKAKQEKEDAERDEELKQWKKRNEDEENSAQILIKNEIDRLAILGFKLNERIPISDGLEVLQIKVDTDYNTREQKLEYHLIHYYKPPRARIFNFQKSCFQTYDEAMANVGKKEMSYSDSKCRKEITSGIILSQYTTPDNETNKY